jgi:exopolysaccharide biosynthesis polyprenyl glycosylphosphotransferase
VGSYGIERVASTGLPGGVPISDADVSASDAGSGVVIRREIVFRRLLGLADAVSMSVALLLAGMAAGGDGLAPGAAAVPLLFVLLAKASGLYDRDAHLLHKTTLDEVPKVIALSATATLLVWLADGAVLEGAIDRARIGTLIGTLSVTMVALRALTRAVAVRITPVERCLFLGDAAHADEFRENLAASHSVRATLVGWLPIDANDGDLLALAARVRALVRERDVHRIIVGPSVSSDEVVDTIRRIKDNEVKVSLLPNVARLVNSSAELDRLSGITLLGLRRFEITFSSRLIKRGLDVAGSALGLLVTAPLLLVVAIAIKLDSPGPVFFRQARAGRHGEAFHMFKFRSMFDGADRRQHELAHLNEAEGVFKITDDPRITRVGRVIRKLHIDELPQLWNVLRGEMSLVGPRPLPLEEDRRIEGWHRRRLDLRPGITGPWQILGSARIPVREMVRLDYQYVADWSLWNDIRILLLTVGHVVQRGGR